MSKTNDDIVNETDWKKSSEILKDGKGILHLTLNLNALLEAARAKGAASERDRVIHSGSYVHKSFMELKISDAIASERGQAKRILTDLILAIDALAPTLRDSDEYKAAEKYRRALAEGGKP